MYATLVATLLCLSAVAAPVGFYVSPQGDDANPGSFAAPWKTLAHARDSLRPLIAAGLKDDVVVVLKAGVYELSEPLTFGPEDSATAGHSITYAAARGEQVIVSGGRRITGWRAAEGGLWVADVPGVKEGEWYPAHLTINGRAATRARTPNADEPEPYRQVAGQTLDVPSKELRLTFAEGMVRDWANATDVEFVCQGNWAINRKHVRAISPAANEVTLQLPADDPGKLPWNWPGPGRWFFWENAREMLDQPGEWYLDRKTGLLNYWPLPGEDMTAATADMPRSVHLLRVTGTPEQPVRNLHFRGIRFEDSAWPLPEGDYHGIQACHFATGGDATWAVVPCAITLECAESCSVTDAVIAHCEAGGIELARRSVNCVIEGNEITDIGGNGVMIGGPNDDAEAPQRNRVASNWVHDIGARFFGATGIWNGFAAETQIVHNQVNDVPYSGISVGWVWNPEASACKAILVADNHIFDCMRKLCDGGGIYTLGLQPGTVIARNLIHDIGRNMHAQGAPNNGMFIDEGSTGFLFQGNVIYGTPESAMRHNRNAADAHVWKDNHFGLAVWADGLLGGALSCPDSFLEVPHSDALEPDHLTLEAWIRLDHWPGSDTRRWVVNKTDDEWTEGHYSLNTDGSKVGAYLNIGGGEPNMLGAWSEEGTLQLGKWHHVAMTYDGKTLRVYADGNEVASKELSRPRVGSNGPLAIGRRQDAYNSFEGLIDEVRVYGRAASPGEIAGRFAMGSATPPQRPPLGPGLVASWDFDEETDAKQILEAIRRSAGPAGKYRGKWGE